MNGTFKEDQKQNTTKIREITFGEPREKCPRASKSIAAGAVEPTLKIASVTSGTLYSKLRSLKISVWLREKIDMKKKYEKKEKKTKKNSYKKIITKEKKIE